VAPYDVGFGAGPPGWAVDGRWRRARFPEFRYLIALDNELNRGIMANDLLSSLKVYLTKIADGERSPAEVVTAVNTWVHESAESIKAKIEEEVEKSVAKMGFVKREEFEALKDELGVSSKGAPKKATTKKATVKKTTAQKAPVKKASAKKASPKKTIKK
jgi:BMFP domain-containing protein YqiC